MRRAALIASMLALAACAKDVPKAPKDETVDAAAKRVLLDRAYIFCHENKRSISTWDRGWCDIADQATTCPELKAMCARPVEDAGLFSSHNNTEKDKSAPAKKPKVAKDGSEVGGGNADSAPWMPDWNLNLPGMKYLAWLLVGAILALVLFVIVRAVLNRRSDLLPDEPEPDPAEDGGALVIEDRGLGEVARLLQRARELADRDVGLALANLYAAALKHLEETGLIHWDRATTNREYVRTIRGRTPIDRPMAELVREVEKTKFGHHAPPRSTFDALYDRLAPNLVRAAAVLLVVGAMFTSACSSCAFGDAGLDGHTAFADVLRSQGFTVTSFAMPIDRLTGRDAPVMVDSADFAFDDQVLASLERSMLSGARILVLLDKNQQLASWPALGLAKDAHGVLLAKGALATKVEHDLAGYLPDELALTLPEVERDPPEVLVERGGKPFAVRWKSEHGQLVFVADRRLVANASLAVPANLHLAIALAREVAGDKKALQFARLGPVTPAASPVESLERAGLWALVLQALIVLFVLVAARGRAFGALRDRESTERRAFSEHVSALGLQLARRKGSRLAASLYASLALERFRQRASRNVGRDLDALAKELSPRLGETEENVRRTLDEAEAARANPHGVSVPPNDLALVRRLGRMLARLQLERHGDSR